MVLLSQNVFAKTVVETRFLVNDDSNQNSLSKFGKISVDEKGVATIETSSRENTNVKSTTVKLNSTVAFEVLETAKELSKAELITTTRGFVCMMMPFGPSKSLLVAQGYNDNSEAFDGDLAVVLSDKGCWNRTVISPKEQYLNDRAETLRSELVTLGQQLAK